MSTLRILIALSLCVAAAYCGCSDLTGTFETYMGCIKGKVTGAKKNGVHPTYQQFEVDYQKDLVDITRKCYRGDSASPEQCPLSESSLLTDAFGPDSVPLEKCGMCKLIAKVSKELIYSASRDTSVCAGDIIRRTLAENLSECVRAKTKLDFKTPTVPNFDEAGFDFKDDIKESLSRCINMRARADVCKLKKANRARATESCILQWVAAGGFQQTCAISGACGAQQRGSCARDVQKCHGATCGCLKEGGDKAKAEITNLLHSLVNLVFAGKNCTLFASRLSQADKRKCRGVADKTQELLQEHANEKLQPEKCVGKEDTKGLEFGNMRCACYWTVREALRVKSDYSSRVTDWYNVVKEIKSTCLGDKDPGAGTSIGSGKITIDGAIFWGCDRILKQETASSLLKTTAEMYTGIAFLSNLMDCAVQRVARFCPCA